MCRRFESGLRYFLFGCFFSAVRRRVRWSGRPIIYQATVTRQSTLIITPQRAHRPRNPPSSMGSSYDTRRSHGTFRSPFVWRRLPSDRCGRCFCGFLGGAVDRFTNPTEPPKNRAPSGERCSPDGCPYSIQTVKGQSSRLSLRSPGNAKPDKDARHPGRSLRRWRVSLIVMG